MNSQPDIHQKELIRQNALLKAIQQMQNNYFITGITYGWCEETLLNLLQLTNSEFGFICELMHKEDGTPYLKSHVITNIAWDDGTRSFYEENKEKGLEFFNFESIWGRVYKTGKPYMSDDPDSDKHRGGYPKESGHPHLKKFLGIPIKGSSNKVIGILAVANNPDGYKSEMVHFLEPFVSTYGILMEQERLKREEKERKEELLQSQIRLKEKNEEYEAANEELLQINDELKETRQLAEENEEKYRTLYTNAPLSYQSLDIDGKIIDINPMWLKTLGYDREEVIGKWFGDFLHEDFVDHFRKNFPEFKKRGYISDVQFKLQKKDETSIYVSFEGCIGYTATGEFKQTYCVFKDITKQHEAEQQLIIAKETAQESEEKFSTIFNMSQSFICVADINTNTFKYINPTFKKVLGYEEEELLSKPFLDFVHPDDVEPTKRVVEEDLRKGKKKFYFVNRYKCKDGSYCHLAWNSFPIPEKGITYAIAHDITKQKEIEEELIAAKEIAEQANNLKTEFLKNMSHEVRTPLNGIMGFSEIICNPGLSEEKRNNYTRIIRNSGAQLIRIIDDILEISQLETRQRKPEETVFSLNQLLVDLYAIFSLKSKMNDVPIYLNKALPDNQSYIRSDKNLIHKILSNLIENAIKFTSRGSIEIGYTIENDIIKLFVRDTGKGIAPENHHKIFERFAQEDKNVAATYGGLGLGLSICKESAELLGGDITLESQKEKGATFTVAIPYKKEKVNFDDVRNSAHNDSAKNDAITVLIAEDEEMNYLFLEALFKVVFDYNYNLIHARNGKEALDICMEKQNIDVILMDIKMPVMSGNEATQKIKEVYPQLPIIAQTAYSTESEKEEAMQSGYDYFLSKPINKDKLLETINTFVFKDSEPGASL